MAEIKSLLKGKYTIKDDVARQDIAEMQVQIEHLNQGEYVNVDLEARADIAEMKETMLTNPLTTPLVFTPLANTIEGEDGEIIEVERPLNSMWFDGSTLYVKTADGAVHEIAFRDDTGSGGNTGYENIDGFPQYIDLSDYGLTQLEYVEFDGTQYVSTSVKNEDTSLVMDAIIMPTLVTAAAQSYYGSYYSNATYFGITSDSQYTNRNTSISFAESTITEPIGKVLKCVTTFSGTTITDNDGNVVELAGNSTTHNIQNLIGGHNAPPGQAQNLANFRLYSFKMSSDSGTLREYIPAIDGDGKALLFDWVNKQSYYSANSVDLIAGPEYTA